MFVWQSTHWPLVRPKCYQTRRSRSCWSQNGHSKQRIDKAKVRQKWPPIASFSYTNILFDATNICFLFLCIQQRRQSPFLNTRDESTRIIAMCVCMIVLAEQRDGSDTDDMAHIHHTRKCSMLISDSAACVVHISCVRSQFTFRWRNSNVILRQQTSPTRHFGSNIFTLFQIIFNVRQTKTFLVNSGKEKTRIDFISI